jgi:protein gp37
MARLHDWWDATWNPIGGCDHISTGCKFCYAAAQAATLHQEAGANRRIVPLYDKTVDRLNGRYAFNGRLTALEPGDDAWTWPLRWSGAQQPLLGRGKPSLIFVADMADLFHDLRPTSVIDRTLGTIAASSHIGMLLTKRTNRMAQYFANAALSSAAISRWQAHLWIGFSAERQRELNRRWPHLRDLAASGWTVFISIAPMLGPVRLPSDFLALGSRGWVIVSGEQGPRERCRYMDANWARSVRDQCVMAGVPFFAKQMARRDPIPPDLFVRQFPSQRTIIEV